MNRHPVREPQGRPNAGPSEKGARRASDPTVQHEVTGEIRWLDPDMKRIVVHVTDTGGHAGAALGEDLTFALDTARITVDDVDGDGERSLRDLLPGVVVRVRTRLPRSEAGTTTGVLHAGAVAMVAAPAQS